MTLTMITGIPGAMVQTKKQPLQLRENQIIQGKITKIYPDNKAEIQIGSHKLVAEITTSLSVGKQYFFQVQAQDQIQLKVIGEQQAANTTSKLDIESLLQELGLKVTRLSSTLVNELVQDKIPFSQEQLSGALSLLGKAENKAEAMEIMKQLIARKLPITEQVFQALQTNRQGTLSHLLQEVYDALTQLKSPSKADQTLIQKIERLIGRPVPQQPAIMEQIAANIKPSPSMLNALKTLGIIDTAVSNQQWGQTLSGTEKTNHLAFLQAYEQVSFAETNAASSTTNGRSSQPLSSMIEETDSPQVLGRVLTSLIENDENIIRAANQMKLTFPSLQSATLDTETWQQTQQIMEKTLFPLLPKETVQIIQQTIQQSTTSQAAQQALSQLLDIFSQSSTFQALSAIASTDGEQLENQSTGNNQAIPEQFMQHVRTYLQSIGMHDEYDIKMNMENTAQLEAMKNDPSIKSMLIGMVDSQDHSLATRAQALVHFINGLQMQTVTEVNNMMQATFTLPGEKLSLNRDVFMQFEGKKDQSGKIDTDFCRILFVLDLANMRETMIDMHVQKRIISVQVYNEQEEPAIFQNWKPMLKEALAESDYQLSAIQWKPLYEQVPSKEMTRNKTGKQDYVDQERYDFLI